MSTDLFVRTAIIDTIYAQIYMRYIKTRSLALFICNVSVIAVFVFLAGVLWVNNAEAAVVTWEGDVDNNWSTDGNWDTGTAPTSIDVATFVDAYDANCDIDATINVKGIDINTGYAGTITQQTGSDITVGTSDFAQDAGTFTGSSNASDDITINGDLTVGSNFTSTKGTLYLAGIVNITGTFTHNSGTVEAIFASGSTDTDFNNAATLYNFIVNKSSWDVNLSGQTIIVEGTLTLTDGAVNNGTIEMQGVTTTVGTDAGNGNADIEFTQSATQTLTCSATYFQYKITVNKAGGSFDFGSNIDTSTDASADFVLTLGTVNLGSYTLNVHDDIQIDGGTFNSNTGDVITDDLRINAGTFEAPDASGSLAISGVLVVDGTFTHNDGTVTLDDTTAAGDVDIYDAVTFKNLVLNKTGGWGLNLRTITIIVTDTLTVTDGYINNGTLEMQGATTTIGANADNGNADFEFTQSATQTLTCNATYFQYKIIVNKAGGSFDFGSNIDTSTDASADFVLTLGTVNLGGYTLDVQDLIQIDGGTFNSNTGDIITDNLTINGGTFEAPDASGSLTISGDLRATGTFTHNDGTVTFDDTTAGGEVNIYNAVTFKNLVLNKTSGWGLNLRTTTTIVTNTLTVTDGYVNNGTLQLQGATITVNADDNGTADFEFTGSATQTFTCGATYFQNKIIVNKAGGSFDFGSDIDVSTDGNADFVLTTGTVNLGSYTLDLHDDLQIDAGTFNGGSGDIVANDVLINGGTFEAPDASGSLTLSKVLTAVGTFSHNNGTVTFDDTVSGGDADVNQAVTFNNLAVNKPGWGLQLSSQTIVAEGALTMTDGRFNSGTVQAQGNVTVASAWDTDTSTTLQFTSSNVQSFDLTGATGAFNADIVINKSGGSVQLASDLTMNQSDQDLTIVEGTFDLNGYDLDINDQANSDFDIEDGGVLRWQGSETLSVNTGDPTLASGSQVIYDPTSGTVSLQDWTYHHLEVVGTGGAVVQMGSTETIAGNLTITSGILDVNGSGLTVSGTFSNLGTLRIQGDETLSLTNDTDSGTIEFVGDGDSAADAYNMLNWTFNNLSVNFTDSADSINGQYLTGTNTMANNLWSYWNLDDGSGSTATDQSANTNNGTLNNMEEGDWITSDLAPLTFTNTNGLVFDGGTSNEYVEFTSDAAFNDRSVSLWFKTSDTSSRQVLFQEGGTSNGMNIYIDGGKVYGGSWGSGINSVFLSGNISADTWTNVILTFDDTGNLELFIGNVSQGTSATGGSMPAHTAQDSLAAKLGDTKYHDGTSNGNGHYFNGRMDEVRVYERVVTSAERIALAAGSNDSRTSTPLSSLTVNSNFTQAGGTFTAPTGTMTVKGNFANTGGTFTHNSGTVALSDSGVATTVSGNTTFNNLSMTTNGDTITFTHTTTTTVAGTFTVTGASGQQITLASSDPGTTWLLNVSGTSSVDYVHVTDSDASGGNAITHVDVAHSTDNGNNTNWGFNVAPTVTSVTAVQESDGTVTITFIMDDGDDDNTLEALVQYNVGGGNTKATLSETDGDTSATYGDPKVENDDTYQVGNASGYITSSSGANTVTTQWNASTDETGIDISTATITVTPYDGTEAGTPSSSSNFSLDLTAPTVSSASYKDTNADGTVDRVDIVFNENVSLGSYNTADWSFSEQGTITLDDSGASASTDTILLTVTADANETGGATAPTVLYTNAAGRLTDAYNNAVATFGAAQTVTDAASPRMNQIGYRDSDADGQIDSAVLAFSETVTIVYDDGDWVTVANDLTNMDVSAIASGNGTSSVTFTATAAADITGGSTQPTIAFTPTTGSIQDSATNAATAFSATSFVDEAKPVILTSTPTDTSTVQSRTNAIVWNFSEAMATGGGWVHASEFTSTPNPGGWGTASWSNSDKTVTVSHAPFLCITDYSIATDDTVIAAAAGETGYTALDDSASAPIGTALTFTTMTCTGTSSSQASQVADTMSYPVTDDIDVADGAGAADEDECSGVEPGAKIKLSWSVTSSVGFVNLYYSTDQGETYATIASQATNSGSYSWIAPEGLSEASDIQFKIEGTDLVEITSTYETGLMDICEVEEVDEDDDAVDDADDTADAADGEEEAEEIVVPIGMAIESAFGDKWTKEVAKREIDTSEFPVQEVAIGSLVKLVDDGDPATQADSAVYYVGADQRRHPFPNESVYSTWFTTFHGIKTIEQETMSAIPMGPMVTYRPGSTLVKFPSVNKVYAIDADGSLRWIATEELVEELYGDEWNKFIVDISEAFYSSYEFGTSLSSMEDMTWDTVMALYAANK